MNTQKMEQLQQAITAMSFDVITEKLEGTDFFKIEFNDYGEAMKYLMDFEPSMATVMELAEREQWMLWQCDSISLANLLASFLRKLEWLSHKDAIDKILNPNKKRTRKRSKQHPTFCKIKTTSNKQTRTFTITCTHEGCRPTKYRTLPVDKNEFERMKCMTESEWEDWLGGGDWYYEVE